VSERQRLFVALDLPEEVRAELSVWCHRAAPAVVRRVPSANLHLTLAFLGSRSADDAAAVAALLGGLARDALALATDDAVWLPRRRPGVLAVALDGGPALGSLHAAVGAALADAIAFVPERRPFRPHVTVGRVPRGVAVGASRLEAPPSLTFRAPSLTLYRSRTAADGARYEALGTVSLGG
jgi:2'-5' RNA ligase